MLLDVSHAPLVYIHEEVESPLSFEEQVQQLFEKGQPFVLITHHKDHDHSDETPDERREKALMFKRIKSRLTTFCRGMVVVEGDEPTSGAVRMIATTASKAFGFAVVFAADDEDATRQGNLLLSKAP